MEYKLIALKLISCSQRIPHSETQFRNFELPALGLF